MIGSEYIAWAKSRERFRYNIGRSSIRPCPPELLSPESSELAINGANAWGWPPLLEAIARRYDVQTEQVTLAVGASMANHLACAALLSAGDHVLVESPGYEPLAALPGYLGADVVRFRRSRVDGYALDPGRVAARLRPATKLVIVSDLHNPSGRDVGKEGWQGLVELADKHGFHVLVDEVYREFVYRPGRPLAVHRSPRFISTSSLTKAYGLDGLRAGWILAEPGLSRRIRHLNDLFGIIMPHPSEQLALRAFERQPVLRRGVEELLAANRPLVESFISSHDALAWCAPPAGPVGLVQFDGDVEALVSELENRYDSTLPSGRHFGEPGSFRIGFGMLTPELRAGLENLGSAIDNQRV